MISLRSFILLSFALIFCGTNVSAQIFSAAQPHQQQPSQQPQTVLPRMQQVPVQQQPMQMPPMQTPPFGVQGGTPIYQQNPNQLQPVAQPAIPQMQMGMNAGQMSTGPMNTQINTGQPMNMGQQVRTAATVPGQAVPLYGTNGTTPMQQTVQPVVQGIPQGMQHMGRAEPANRVVPFFLNPEEQRELDEFLARWERYSAPIHLYEVSFNLFLYDPTMPEAQPNRPYKIAFGYFMYNANPKRFVFEVEGEWQGTKQIKWDDKNPSVLTEKVIIDERSVYQYDHPTRTIRQINVPPEMIGKGIADSPLPLIFGAKADDLKRRFSMRIVPDSSKDDIIWLIARPLLTEDQQEFKELEILLDKKTLTARGLKQWDINGKAYRAFELQTPQINRRVNLVEFIRDRFTPDIPRGWKKEEKDWVASPPSAPAIPQPPMGNQPPRSGVPLYRTQ